MTDNFADEVKHELKLFTFDYDPFFNSAHQNISVDKV